MAKNVLIVIGLILFGVLVFCLCCYKVTNLLYQLFTIDSQPDMGSPTILPPQQQQKHPLPQQPEKSHLPDYGDSAPTPRCSRHSTSRLIDNYSTSSTHELLKQGEAYSSKEELAMVNLNHFPSAGELRDSSAGYTSIERLLPPYPCPPAPPHRKPNGVTGGGFDISSSVHARLDNPHSYSYSFSNISDMQPGKVCQDRLDTTQLAHVHCCSSQKGSHRVHQNLPTHHIATLRRNNTGVQHGDPRLCGDRYQASPPRPFHRQASRESLSDREVSAMFHRDTLLARL